MTQNWFFKISKKGQFFGQKSNILGFLNSKFSVIEVEFRYKKLSFGTVCVLELISFLSLSLLWHDRDGRLDPRWCFYPFVKSFPKLPMVMSSTCANNIISRRCALPKIGYRKFSSYFNSRIHSKLKRKKNRKSEFENSKNWKFWFDHYLSASKQI